MFTGIVAALGSVSSLTPNPFGVRLLIDPGNWNYHPAPGDSIAVSGVCLTVLPSARQSTAPSQCDNPPSAIRHPLSTHLLSFDVIKETLSRTTLGSLLPGASVNLESSLRPDTPIAGHFVQGHVDGIGAIVNLHSDQDESRLTIELDAALMPYIVPKGSVTLDGVSLTICSVDTSANTFTVALIPTTLNITTLGRAKLGDHLNIETDILARTVVHYLSLLPLPWGEDKGEGFPPPLPRGEGRGEGGRNRVSPPKTPPSQITLDKLRAAGFYP